MRIAANMALSSAMLALIGCSEMESGDKAVSEPTGTESTSPGYNSEIRSLKSRGLETELEDAMYSQIQRKYGIVPESGANTGEAPVAKPVSPRPLAKSAGQADDFTWEQRFATEALPLKIVSYQQFQLSAGTKWLMATANGTTGVDPVMAVFQYDDANWKATGYISSNARTSMTLLGYNDDHVGNHPAVVFTPPTTGYYAVVVYAYSATSFGSATFVSGPACSTLPPGGYCWNGRPLEKSINVQGRAINPFSYYGLPLNGFKLESADQGDPMVYVFDYLNNLGLYNDDNEDGGTLSSFAWKYPVGFNPNTSTVRVIVGGYRDGGTAVLKGFTGILKYPPGPTH